jgi:hypothetical protein
MPDLIRYPGNFSTLPITFERLDSGMRWHDVFLVAEMINPRETTVSFYSHEGEWFLPPG